MMDSPIIFMYKSPIFWLKTSDLFTVVKVSIEPAILFGEADNRRMVHQYTTVFRITFLRF